MTQEAAVPDKYLEQIRQMVRQEVASAYRSAANRNASISEGGTFTIKGGRLRVKYPEADGGGESVYVGDIYSGGSYIGTGMLIQAPDGTDMMVMRTDVTFGTTMHNIYDSGGRIIFGNDALSGQGLARPYVTTPFYRQRFADWSVGTTSASFEGLWKAELVKQHPKLSVATQSAMDTSGATGEIRVLVNGVQMGSTQPVAFALGVDLFGPAAVAGDHMELLTVEIQGRVTSGAGALKVEPLHMLGRQS